MRRTWLWVLAAVVAAAAVAGALTVVLTRGGSGRSVDLTVHAERVPAGGGVTLSAEVVTPPGNGPFPLLVLPAPWVAPATVYDVLARSLADHGYAVVAYGQRGSRDSGGENDMMGPKTQGDVSTVISWALAHIPADGNRVGAMGISYGAGASLLAAERDPRIKAVVALSAWTSLRWSFDPSNTLAANALSVLLGSARQYGHLAPQLVRLAEEIRSDPPAAQRTLIAMSPVRSPMTRVAALNHNHTAVMIANAWEDSIFSPDQLIPFFENLHTPKRLQLARGDHGGPERSALYGQPNTTVDDAIAWLDHYLRGTQNGIQRADPIQLQDVTDLAYRGYRTWPTAETRVALGAPGTAGDVGSAVAPTWRAQLSTGVDSGAQSGPALFQPSAAYVPPAVPIPTVSTSRAFVWSGPTTAAPTQFVGAARLRLQVASSAPRVSLFTYVYDADTTGVGRLMSTTPYTVAGLGGGQVRAVRIDLRPVSWTIAAGHHVVIVVDSVDSRYVPAAPAGSTLTVSSTAADPATFSAPIGA